MEIELRDVGHQEQGIEGGAGQKNVEETVDDQKIQGLLEDEARRAEGAQRLLPDEGAQRLLPDEGAQRLLPDEGAQRLLPDAASPPRGGADPPHLNGVGGASGGGPMFSNGKVEILDAFPGTTGSSAQPKLGEFGLTRLVPKMDYD